MIIRQITPLILRRDIERPAFGTFAVLHADFKVEYGESMVLVPVGFPTDLASVPKVFRSLISKVTGVEASIVHDWLYDQRAGTRKAADDLFYAMLKQSESRWVAWIMYRAVRLGGSGVWRDGVPWA